MYRHFYVLLNNWHTDGDASKYKPGC